MCRGKAPFRALIPLAVLAIGFGGYLSGHLGTASAQEPSEPLEFNRDVRPILNQSCLLCHGPNETTRQADLRFDTDNCIGSVVLPGDAEASTTVPAADHRGSHRADAAGVVGPVAVR